MQSPTEPPHLHKTTERLGTDPLGKLLLRLSLPAIISMVAVSLYNLVDAFWVAKLGHEYMAAITILMPYHIFLIAVGLGTGVGLSALVSRRFGERDVEAAHIAAGQALPISIAVGLLFLAVSLLFPQAILRISGAPADVMEPARQYLTMIAWGFPFFMMGIIGRNVFHAAGDSVRPMVFTIAAQVINAVLDPALIFGWWGFPEMGIAGAGLATAIANGVGAVLALCFLLAKGSTYRFRPHHALPNLRAIVDIYRVGLPATLMDMTESVVFVLFNHVIAAYGSVALAALGIAGRIADLAFMPVIGTANGLLPIIGFSFGAKLWGRLWGSVKLACLWLVALMAVATLLLEVFTPQVVALFNSEPELLEIAVPGMRIFVSTLVFIGPAIVFITTFQGISRGKDAMMLSLARQFIFFLPALYGLSALMGLKGIWLSMPVSDTLGVTVAALWLWREYHKQKRSKMWEGRL